MFVCVYVYTHMYVEADSTNMRLPAITCYINIDHEADSVLHVRGY